MKKIIFLLELGLLLTSISLFSQTYLINTDYCIVSDNSFLIVNGYANNQSSGNLYLTGANSNVIVQNNITNNGTINSSGIIELYGDWINDSTCIHNNTSNVYLKGTNQNIGGNATTTFYNLYLQGTGVKTLGNDEVVANILDLGDLELATQGYTMSVTNTATNAVQRVNGFVSSTLGGGLARATNSDSAYLFPVGVSGKYRPAEVTPSSTTLSIFKVRMANDDATNEQYDRSIKAPDVCEVDSSFFHIMQQTSGTNNYANIKVYYDNNIDGSWNKVGYWNDSLWNNYTGSSTSIGSPLYYGIADSVSLSSSTPIALTKNAPVLSISASHNPICSGQSTVLTATGADTYSWNTGGNTASITIAPSSTTTYTVIGTSNAGCSDSATTEITVYQSPNVISYTENETCIDANDGIAWVKVTGGTQPYNYLWSHSFSTNDSITNLVPGEYYVTVTDNNNCSDKDTVLIKPGTEYCYITHIYVPNVFSPDNIGNTDNEYLKIYGKGIETIDFSIFDRWGNEVFHTEDMSVGWDGTYKGQPALAGDYTYVLRVNFLNGNREALKGHILLIR